MIPVPTKTYTPEEYLELEIISELRHEYRNGEIIPMTGGTPTHNEIVGALTVILRLALEGKPLQVFITDQRLWIPDRQIHTYPDVMVVAKSIELQPGRKDTSNSHYGKTARSGEAESLTISLSNLCKNAFLIPIFSTYTLK